MDPELRSQILQALAKAHKSLPKGQAPTAAGDDDFIRQVTNGQMKGMADLIPSTPDVSEAPSVPLGTQAMNGLRGLGHAATDWQMGPRGLPTNPTLAKGAANAVQNAFTTLSEPFLGGLPGGVPQSSLQDYGNAAAATGGNALMAMAPGVGSLARAGLMAGGGAAQTPSQPLAGATAGLAGYGLGEAIPAGAGVIQRLGIRNPVQRAANQINQVGLAASAEDPLASLGRLAPEGKTTANPMLANANPVLAKQLTDAIGDNPQLYATFTPEQRAQISGAHPDLGDGIRAKTQEWAAPQYDAMRAKYPSIDIGSSQQGATVGEAMAEHLAANNGIGRPRVAEPLYDAMRQAQAMGKLPQNAPEHMTIPGTESTVLPSVDDILSTPTVQKALADAQDKVALGLPTAGKPYSFQDVRDAMLFLEKRADNYIKGADKSFQSAGFKLKDAAAALDAQLMRQVPEYAPTQLEYGARMRLADQADEQAGKFVMPPPPTFHAISHAMSPFMSLRWWAAKPVIGNIVKNASQNTATEIAQMLSSRGQNINDVLAELASRQKQPVNPAIPVGAGALAAQGQQP